MLQEPSFDLVLSVLEGLDDDDLEQQVAFIEGSMYAHLARETTASRPVTSTEETEEDVGRTAVWRGFRRPGARSGGGDPVARHPHRGR